MTSNFCARLVIIFFFSFIALLPSSGACEVLKTTPKDPTLGQELQSVTYRTTTGQREFKQRDLNQTGDPWKGEITSIKWNGNDECIMTTRDGSDASNPALYWKINKDGSVIKYQS